MNARDLQRLLASGLYTANEDGIRTKEAATTVAAAQLRAIRFALLTDNETGTPSHDDGRIGWCASDDRFDRIDAFHALGGVVALLDATRYLCDEVDKLADEEMPSEARESEVTQ